MVLILFIMSITKGSVSSETEVAGGNFDVSGQATISGLENDVEYDLYVSIDSSKEYLDNVVTVSDLALVFAEAIGAGITEWNLNYI
jgi:hypothetical protein